MSPPSRRLAAAVAAFGLAVAACAGPPEPDDGSSGFTVGYVPDGLHPSRAGEGGARLAWGDDSEGTQRPLTVLDRSDDGETEPVHVTFFGYEGTQQESPFGDPRDREAFELDGHPARYRPASPDFGGTWSLLTVDFGDDLAVNVSAPSATREDLLAILASVDVPDGGPQVAAPTFDSLPRGVSIVGSMDARAVLGENTYAWGAREMHGPPGSHVATWIGPGDLQLIVQTLPGEAADLAGIAGARRDDHEVVSRVGTIDGRRMAIVESTEDDQPPHRQTAVWFHATWGDLVHVVSRGSQPLSLEETARIATSIEEASTEEWAAFIRDF